MELYRGDGRRSGEHLDRLTSQITSALQYEHAKEAREGTAVKISAENTGQSSPGSCMRGGCHWMYQL